MENIINKNEWKVRFEVTFYGNDPTKGSFREIKEDTIVINAESQLHNTVYRDHAESVDIYSIIYMRVFIYYY